VAPSGAPALKHTRKLQSADVGTFASVSDAYTTGDEIRQSTEYRSMSAAAAPGSNRSSNTVVAPATNGNTRLLVNPAPLLAGNDASRRWPGPIHDAAAPASAVLKTAPCVRTTIFGLPVDPELVKYTAGCDADQDWGGSISGFLSGSGN